MTGSLLFARQHSSTVGHPIKNKMSKSKFRRSSSADDQNSLEISLDHKEYKKKLSNKSDQTTSDADSGIEDLDQQVNNLALNKPTDAGEEELFGACEDEEIEQHVVVKKTIDSEQNFLNDLHKDLILAALIPDEDKKFFCSDTSVVFHAEFARRISCPISLKHPGCRYHLYSEEEVVGDPMGWNGFAFCKLDNAKAQFKCSNEGCGRSWTSMRARIAFTISRPQTHGFVVLKIFGQNCQTCGTPAEALWYMDEVCRVMKNLAECISSAFYLSIVAPNQTQSAETTQCVSANDRRVVSHDPAQRKGKMHAPHNRNRCEACQRGWCFQ